MRGGRPLCLLSDRLWSQEVGAMNISLGERSTLNSAIAEGGELTDEEVEVSLAAKATALVNAGY